MAIGYFKKKENWINISREERLYCAHLYFQIRADIMKFVDWLNDNKNLSLPTNCEWEIGYEVCFYRDYLKNLGEDPIRVENRKYPEDKYSEKRTFDLCLFSENHVIIIEAKVKEHFGQEQLNDTIQDEKLVRRVLKSDLKVYTILLAQSKYINSDRFLGTKENQDKFDKRISWEEMNNLYPDDIFSQADKLD